MSVLAPLTSLRLILVRDEAQKAEFDRIVTTFHSYVPTTTTVGRRLNYLVEYSGKLVGAIGVSSIAIPMPYPLLVYFRVEMQGLGMKVTLFKTGVVDTLPILDKALNNWRFTLSPDAPHNCASRVLKCLRIVCTRDWEKTFGVRPLWLVTYIHLKKNGTGYRADGWKFIGYTGNSFGAQNQARIKKKMGEGARKTLNVDMAKRIFVRRLF